ncbi:RNA methyltransferase [Tahibacter amnicola]|uniref:tRNA (cytidine/uridine-2'-O-)-methyltransferase TrmJ n=1 Tax=Tahibacter amnicola TaxID=2976241 RepID=A0ABY6BFW1_9GAMM|nr:RNA methyltransferase [Tahibacter amnicola]UXI67255.1 RNA methyltransferase [Tahibacter amnicola]
MTVDPASTPAGRTRFVLVRTSHPGNIGAAARAIRTMGFGRLVLVAPYRFPDPEADAFAAGAVDVLERAIVVPDLAAAIGDCRLVMGATARQRNVALREHTPREAGPRAVAEAQDGGEVALVFGNERTGLENDELALCHAAVHIPADPDYSSLNLAQAVQVLAYELRVAALGNPTAPPPRKSDPPADAGAMEGFFQHLATTLDDIDFHKGRSPETILLRLRKLFLRAQPDERELRVLRGILSDAQRMARLAGYGPKAGTPTPDGEG